MNNKRIISPSISSGPDEEEILHLGKRKRESLSPELDLSLPELDLSSAHVEVVDLSYANSDFPQEEDLAINSENITHNRRAASPPLEHDEREFTQTATSMQQRRQNEQEKQEQQAITSPSELLPGLEIIVDQGGLNELESEESAALRNQEAATALFGQSRHLLHIGDDAFGGGSSPMMRPVQSSSSLRIMTTPQKSFDVVDCLDLDLDGEKCLFDDGAWELKSAESVELSELDDLLGEY